CITPQPPSPTLFPYTTLFRSRTALTIGQAAVVKHLQQHVEHIKMRLFDLVEQHDLIGPAPHRLGERAALVIADIARRRADQPREDRKSTRLNSSHLGISYAVF